MEGGLLKEFIDFIFPPRRSEALVRALALTDLQSLQRTPAGFSSSSGVLPYHQEEVAALVWELKYYGSARAAALAGALLSEELLAIAADELGQPLLVPVPLHKSRLRERGHNQTELLCKAALQALGAPLEYAPRALERIINTPHQQGLERSKRLLNVKNSMRALEPEKIRGRVCVVVDDVTTTGATLTEAARALKAAGAARVHMVALAQS